MWNFHNLTPEAGDQVREFWPEYPQKILQIYLDFKVAPGPISACCAIANVKQWTEYGLAENLIPCTNKIEPDTSTG